MYTPMTHLRKGALRSHFCYYYCYYDDDDDDDDVDDDDDDDFFFFFLKGLAHDVFDTSATHFGLVYVVTGTEYRM